MKAQLKSHILAGMRGLSPDRETKPLANSVQRTCNTRPNQQELRERNPVEARHCWIGFQDKSINGEGLKPKGEAPTWLTSARQS